MIHPVSIRGQSNMHFLVVAGSGSGTPPAPPPSSHFTPPSSPTGGGNASAPSVRKVLCCDDNPFILKVLKRALSRDLGIPPQNIVQAVNMKGALAVFDDTIAAVVTDVDMPIKGEGFELYKVLREGGFQGPIVIASGRVDPESQEAAQISGDENALYVEKPFEPKSVSNWIQSRWADGK